MEIRNAKKSSDVLLPTLTSGSIFRYEDNLFMVLDDDIEEEYDSVRLSTAELFYLGNVFVTPIKGYFQEVSE